MLFPPEISIRDIVYFTMQTILDMTKYAIPASHVLCDSLTDLPDVLKTIAWLKLASYVQDILHIWFNRACWKRCLHVSGRTSAPPVLVTME